MTKATPKDLIKKERALLILSEGKFMTIMMKNSEIGEQTLHWSSSWELTSYPLVRDMGEGEMRKRRESNQERHRQPTRIACDFETSKPTPSDMSLLTGPYLETLPNSSTNWDQVFIYMNLWGPFSFKLPHKTLTLKLLLQ